MILAKISHTGGQGINLYGQVHWFLCRPQSKTTSAISAELKTLPRLQGILLKTLAIWNYFHMNEDLYNNGTKPKRINKAEAESYSLTTFHNS